MSKWHKEIKAWADGAEIEVKCDKDRMSWKPFSTHSWNDSDYEFRIKPQPKEPQYLYVFTDTLGNTFTRTHNGSNRCDTYIGKIKLEVDDD